MRFELTLYTFFEKIFLLSFIILIILVSVEGSDTQNLFSFNEKKNNFVNQPSKSTSEFESLKNSYLLNSSPENSESFKDYFLPDGTLSTFVEFQKGEVSNDIDVSSLIFDIIKFALDGNGSGVLPSLELLDFIQRVVDLSKYDTITTIDFIFTFISKDRFSSGITNDLKKLKAFNDYLSYLIQNGKKNFEANTSIIGNYKLNKELLGSIKVDVYSAIWEMEELIKNNRIMEYELCNLNGTTVYSTQPVIGRLMNDVYTNKPRVVFNHKYTKSILKKTLGNRFGKFNGKFKRLYNKLEFPLNSKKTKRLSLELINAIYISVIILNDLYKEGLSSNVLSPGLILVSILRDDIDCLPSSFIKNLTESNVDFGVSEREIKIDNNQISSIEISYDGTNDKSSNSCIHSALGNKIREIFKEYGIDSFFLLNEILKEYNTSFQPPKNILYGYLEPRRYFDFLDKSDSTKGATFKRNWFSDVTKLVLDGVIATAIEKLDVSVFLERSLSRNGVSSAILVGSSIIGKRISIDNLSYRIVNGKSSYALRGYKVIIIDLESLLEICTNPKKSIVEQIKINLDSLLLNYDGKVILFIEEPNLFRNIDSENQISLINILAPSILNGSLKVIGTSSSENFKAAVKKNPELSVLFEEIEIPETSGIAAEILLMSLRREIELSTGILIHSETIKVAVKLCTKYIRRCTLPESAIDLINSAISIALTERFTNLPSALNVLEDSIKQCRKGLETSKLRDYQVDSAILSSRHLLAHLLRKFLRKRNQIISVSLKIEPYLARYRNLKNQLYFFSLIYTKYGINFSENKETPEDEFKVLEEREKVIPQFSTEMSVRQLTDLYRKNLVEYKYTNSVFNDEAINKEIATITQWQLKRDFSDDIHPVIKQRHEEVSELKLLISEMSLNYQSPYTPLGIGEIDATHIAYIISEKVNISMRLLLYDVGYKEFPADIKLRISEILSRYVVGQEESIKHASIQLSVQRNRKLNIPRVFFLAGPPGSGKKTFAHALYIAHTEHNNFMERLSYDPNEFSYFKVFEAADFSDEDAVNRLLDESTGTGLIPEITKQISNVAILFNLIEKMHPSAIDLLAKILQNKDNFNEKIGLINSATFIFTSNIGEKIIIDNYNEIGSSGVRLDVIREIRDRLGEEFFTPINNILLFKPFSDQEMVRILEINLSEYSIILKKKYKLIFITPPISLIRQIVEKNYSRESGSEPFFTHVDKFIKNKIKELIATRKLRPGNKFRMSINENFPNDAENQPYNFSIIKS